MRMVPRNVVIAMVVALCGIAAALYFKSRPSPVSDPVGYYVQALQKIVPDLQMASLPPTEHELSALLAQGGFTPINERAIAQRQAALPPFDYIEAADEIRNHVAAMLHTRLRSNDASEYIAWRETNGYRLVTISEFNESYSGYYDWTRLVSEHSALRGHTVEDVKHAFHLFWRPDSKQDGFSRIIKIANSVQGLHLAFGQTWADDPYTLFQERIVTNVPFETWYGGTSSACMKWFYPPRWATDILKQEGTVYTASLGFIAGFSNAPPRPIVVKLFYDPRMQRWYIDRVYHQNYHDRDGLSPCMEM